LIFLIRILVNNKVAKKLSRNVTIRIHAL